MWAKTWTEFRVTSRITFAGWWQWSWMLNVLVLQIDRELWDRSWIHKKEETHNVILVSFETKWSWLKDIGELVVFRGSNEAWAMLNTSKAIHMKMGSMFFYRPQGKAIFHRHLSVILFTVSLMATRSLLTTRGLYASYWKAFLFSEYGYQLKEGNLKRGSDSIVCCTDISGRNSVCCAL